MGRLRKKPWADEYLKTSKYVKNSFNLEINNWKKIFKNENPIEIEIGHGKGDFLIEKIKRHQDINFIGVEKNETVQALAIKKILSLEEELKNLYFLNIDAIELSNYFNEKEISKIYINFPDPWPKERHKKRRLLYLSYLEMYFRLLKKSGVIEFKTDNLDLFEFALIEIEEFKKFKVIDKIYDLYKNIDEKKEIIKTEYEKKFLKEGRAIYYLKLRK